MNFANLTGLSDSYGNVVQIADEAGRVIWKLETNKPVILQVEKITSDTYAGETTYTGEQFILLDIYPKTNGTVNVTYGGLTKTITDTSGAAEPNSQQVFFGTFNGVSDSVATPASGTLTIEGDYERFTTGSFSASKIVTAACGCVTGVVEWGNIGNSIPYSFANCAKLTISELPNNITSIGDAAFNGCTSLALTSLPSGITSIGGSAFSGCTSLALTSLPNSITSIGISAFSGCTNLALTSLPSALTEIANNAFSNCTNLALTSLPNGITTIGISAFSKCLNIKITEFPEGLASIGDAAFYMLATDKEMTAMYGETIILPSTLHTIAGQPFNCEGKNVDADDDLYLAGAIFRSTTPPSLTERYPFGTGGEFRTTFTIYVPAGCVDAYRAGSGWDYACISGLIVEAS